MPHGNMWIVPLFRRHAPHSIIHARGKHIKYFLAIIAYCKKWTLKAKLFTWPVADSVVPQRKWSNPIIEQTQPTQLSQTHACDLRDKTEWEVSSGALRTKRKETLLFDWVQNIMTTYSTMKTVGIYVKQTYIYLFIIMQDLWIRDTLNVGPMGP